MNYHYACVLLQVFWFLLIGKSVTLTIIPICLTWNATDTHLTVECTVQILRHTHDILIIDPFGNNRMQCTFGESQICSGSHDYVLHEDISENITTLKLKTGKYNAEGEWKCRHDNNEAKSNVSFTEGIISTVDIVLSGEFWKTKGKNGFRLACSSCTNPYNDGADFFVNNKLEDSIRYQDGLCYHKRNLCKPGKCTCSSQGKSFSWNYISNMTNIQFACAMRFKEKLKQTILIHKGFIFYNGSDFIQTQKTNTSIDYAEKNPDNILADKEIEDHIGYWILGTACLIILTVLLICFWQIYKRRKKQGNDVEEKNLHELMPLRNSQSTYDKESCSRICSVEDIKIACLSHNDDREIEYTSTLKRYLQEWGLRSNNITFINEDSLDDYFSQALKEALKLIIVIPYEFELKDSHFYNFHLAVEKAVRLFKENFSLAKHFVIPIVRSKEGILPSCLSGMIQFSSLEQEFKDAILQCSANKTIDKCLPSTDIFNIVLVGKNLEQLSISKRARELLENCGLELLKGWGVHVEKDRVSFHLQTLHNLSDNHHIWLHDIVPFIFRNRSFRFIRLYDVVQFDLRDLQLYSDIYNEVTQIFKMIIDMKGKSWYHYRRNGLGHKSSSEGAFKLVKKVFMNKEPSVIFHQFDTDESRLATFQNYPIELKAFRKRLAEAGFFYFNVSDYVQCFNCGGCLRAWKSMNDPMERHRRNFKTCPFVLESKKINRSEEDSTYKTSKINNSLYTTEDRLYSFKYFPVKVSEEDLQRLSKAGFYYCGIAEDIVCCGCNIGFAGVQDIDIILKLHEKYSQDCRNIDNLTTIKDADDPECISNFVPYLELECRDHDF